MAFDALLLAYAAGVFTTLSPCSYPLLPGYFGYLLGSGSRASTFKALLGGLLPTAGIVMALSGLGALAGALGSMILEYLPLLEFVVAAAIILLGALMVANKPLPLRWGRLVGGRGGYLGLLTFGIGYGLASSACAAPIFFSVILFALLRGVVGGMTTLLFYSLGIGSILTATSLFVSEADEYFVRRMGRLTHRLHRMGGLGLLGAGTFLLLLLAQFYGIIPPIIPYSLALS